MSISNKNNITKYSDVNRKLTKLEVDTNFQELKNVVDDIDLLTDQVQLKANKTDVDNINAVSIDMISNIDNTSDTDKPVSTAQQEALDLKTNIADLASTDPGKGAALVGFKQAGTGAVERTLEDKAREWVSVKDFGAVGDGVTDDTEAIQTAFSETLVNDVIIFPNGVYIVNTDINATGKIVLLYGSLLGSGSLIGDSILTNIVNSIPKSFQSVFGENFKASSSAYSSTKTTHIGDSRFTSSIVKNTSGSGANGPNNCDGGLFVEVSKDNWLTSQESGEIDGEFIVVRQGKESDAGGLLIDIKKVKGSTGGAVAIECANEWVDSSNLRLMRIQTIKNFTEGVGGHSGNTGYGFYAEAQAGEPFSAFYAGGSNDGGSNSPGAFQNLIVFYSSRLSTGGQLVYKVDGNGKTYTPSGTQETPSYSFHQDPDTGIYRVGENALGVTTGGIARWVVNTAGNIWPVADNSYSIGIALQRVSVVYAATGTINTSDEREKEFLETEEAETQVALELKSMIKKFKFKDAIEKKGDLARIHFGVGAQSVAAVFEKYNLNPADYALFCYDEWEEQPEVKDEDGNVTQEYRPAGNRYGIRYEELLAFIISAM